MTEREPPFIQSAANPLYKELKRLAHDSGAYRKEGRVWLEGDHLCRAALDRNVQPEQALFAESAWHAVPPELKSHKGRNVVVADALFAALSPLESPARMGFVVVLPEAGGIAPNEPAVILDGLQDPGNAGSILRSASAFGVRQVIATKGTVALWSTKVLRAGMGAHFGLRLVEQAAPEDLDALRIPLIVTSSHAGDWLQEAKLPSPCAWVLGHEGQGVSGALAARASMSVRIPQPGGEESLNVAAAAAVVLYASLYAGLRARSL